MKYKLICNPLAGRGRAKRRLSKIKKLLSIKDKDVYITSSLRDAENAAMIFAGYSPGVILCMGGDGILNAVINGILSVTNKIPVGFIPVGGCNVAAFSCGIPLKLKEASNIILNGRTRRVDLGRVSLGRYYKRYFFSMIDFGLTAYIVHRIEKDYRIKRYWGKLSYIGYGLYYYLTKAISPIYIETDDFFEKAYHVVAANGAYYGGKFKIAPADLFDGKLDLCIFKGEKKSDLLKYVAGFLKRKHLEMREVKHLLVKKAEITSDEPIPSQIDGEPFLFTPCSIEVVPKAISMILP